LTGGLAHDFNNLLGVVVGNLDLAAERLKADPKAGELIDAALNGALRGAELVKKLLAFSRRQPLEPKVVDLNADLPEIVALLKRTLGENIAITAKPAAGLWPVLADPTQVESAILNLAVNARDAMPNGGTLTIETANAHLDSEYVARNPFAAAGDYAMISVGDEGTGMPPEVIEKAFDPFFTTKPTGKGTGLGLSMVYGFVKQSRGHVKIYSELGHGTVVKIYLPRADAEANRNPGRTGPAEALPRGNESILLVEDNPGVREMAERQLAALGYRVLAVENAAAALAEFEGGAAPDLLLTDVVMPGGMSGYDLAAEALRRRPGLKVLFTSGFNNVSAMKVANGLAGPVLRKPYRRPEMARMVRRVLDGNRGVKQ
jgi:CheY-like chemotaxis protein